MNLEQHWNNTYTRKSPHQLGWYESRSIITLDLIQELGLDKEAHILSVGAGVSNLIKDLIAEGYSNITVNDISNKALALLKDKLKQDHDKVSFIVDDLTNSEKLHLLDKVEVWQDRAVLHFFTEKEDQYSYFKLLNELIKPGGYAIIGVFSTKGAKKCSGLELQQYDIELLASKMGSGFRLIKSLEHDHLTPSFSSRPYVYAVFQKL